jgi:hypothetical protein
MAQSPDFEFARFGVPGAIDLRGRSDFWRAGGRCLRCLCGCCANRNGREQEYQNSPFHIASKYRLKIWLSQHRDASEAPEGAEQYARLSAGPRWAGGIGRANSDDHRKVLRSTAATSCHSTKGKAVILPGSTGLQLLSPRRCSWPAIRLQLSSERPLQIHLG